MEFAVIKTGGKQYRVKAGETLKIEKLPGAEKLAKGDAVTFEEVLLIDTGNESHVGAPTIKGAKVLATFEEAGRNKKIVVSKFKPKTRFRKKYGHRQPYSKIKITEIKHK